MVEVFKTDVTSADQAGKLLVQIHASFKDYRANFDLQDCDHILRVKSNASAVCPVLVIDLLAKAGHHAEVLTDEHQNISEALQMS